jgi:hypothetical protein
VNTKTPVAGGRTAKFWIWPAAAATAVFLLVALSATLAEPRLGWYARSSLMRALERDYQPVIGDIQVHVFPSVRVSLRGVVLRQKDRQDAPPLITIQEASASASWLQLLRRHAGKVILGGLKIQVSPRREARAPQPRSSSIAGFVIDQIEADGTVLVVYPKNPAKEPLEFDIHQLTLHGAGDQPMSFEAILQNAKPPGEIHSTGKFGPWEPQQPADTPVSGQYSLRNANLAVFKGISGILSSDGTYEGVLDRINVQGQTDTPDFTVRISGQPVDLKTQFKAVVDGTDGNTYLDPVNGQFGHSSVVARGSIAGEPGKKGKTVALDATVNNGRLEDMLRLGVKSNSPGMTGAISFHSKIVIPPGDIDIAEKLQLEGAFEVAKAQFSKLNVQEKINSMSHRGQGDPEESPDVSVASGFGGRFNLDKGIITFSKLSFRIPGVQVALNGTYGMLDQGLDLHGTASLEAKLSQTTTGFKSFLLKALDPFFSKKNAGTVLPIKIGGTASSPSFGLDIGRASKPPSGF